MPCVPAPAERTSVLHGPRRVLAAQPRAPRPWSRRLGGIALAVAWPWLAAGCSSDGAGAGDTAQPSVVRCELGTTDPTGVSFAALAEGGDVELTRGFQGYLLILLRLRCEGAAPRRTGLTISASRDEGPARDSAHPGLRWDPAADGSSLSESFEVWLTPALVPEFVGRTGWVEIAAFDTKDAEICRVRRAVRFVDEDICMHFEDGHLDCSADKDTPAP